MKSTIDALRKIYDLRRKLFSESRTKVSKIQDAPYFMRANKDMLSWLSSHGGFLADYAELMITTKCTLKCKYCTAFMPYYKKPQDVPLELLRKSIDRFFEAVDCVYMFRILGGEPLLYPNLYEVLTRLLRYKNRIGVIEVITNNTIKINDERILELAKSHKINFVLGKYPCVEGTLGAQLDEQKISYSSPVLPWLDFGGFENRKRNCKELDIQFRQCGAFCKTIFEGKLYFCPRPAHLSNLGILHDEPSEYVDLLNDSLSVDELRTLTKSLYERTSHLKACNHCNGGTKKIIEIPIAEQVSPGESLPY